MAAVSVSHTKSGMDSETGISGFPDVQIGNQGLRKRIVKKGTSWQTPSLGDQVQVHYSVGVHHQDEQYFDSSRDKGTPFTFKLGQCEVIKGLDDGIATMKKGERAILTIPPELAYGEIGSPPLVPPNSTLVFDVEVVSWITIRDITGDGGILKKITKEGEGWATPKNADEVVVKYNARLENETIVAKCVEGVAFSIIDGHLCPALSLAVKTMRKREQAELLVKPCYGIGGQNRKGDIPLINSNLTIQVELLSWTSVIDVTGDGKVLKKILKAGHGFDRPSEGSLAKVTYVGKFEDGTVLERKGSIEEPFEYICFEEQINEGLDRAIMTMKKGEQATVKISSDFLPSNDEGARTVSADSVLYEVELIDFTKEKPFWKMDAREKIEACEKKKREGNLLFQAGKFHRASKKYDKASNYVEFDHSFSKDEKCQAKALRLSCNLNNAACKLKLGEYLQASRLCTKVLEVDQLNVKALFRRAQAYLKTSDLEKAETDIKRALQIDPNNRDVKLEYKELKDKKMEYKRHEAGIFGNMISRVG